MCIDCLGEAPSTSRRASEPETQELLLSSQSEAYSDKVIKESDEHSDLESIRSKQITSLVDKIITLITNHKLPTDDIKRLCFSLGNSLSGDN